MTQYAIIEDGVVVNVAESSKPLAINWIELPSGGGIGWLHDGESFSPPDEPEPDWPKVIASRRYQEETSGTTINGIPVDTDRQSQALITGAALAATIDPAYVCQWKTSGGFVTLDAAAIIGVATAVRNHVQACFNREAELIAAIEDETYTSDMLNEGWPE